MNDWVKHLLDFLNNASVAAFVGAFFAFFLVALTDWRRKHRRKGLIKRRLAILKEIANAKEQTAQTCIEMIQNNKFNAAPIMRFPVEDLMVLQRETLDILSSSQINAIDALVYWMESIDGLFERARILAEELHQLARENAPTAAKVKKADQMLTEFRDAIVNIKHFKNLAGFYNDGHPEKILEFRVEHR